MRTATVSALAESIAQEQDVTRLAAEAGIALGGRLAGRGIRLLVDIALARLLGPLSFGLFGIGWTITRISTVISPLGLDLGVIRFGSQHWRKDSACFKGVIFQSLKLALFSGLVAGIALYVAAPWVGKGVFRKADLTPVIRCFALAIPLITVLRVAAAATRISQRMNWAVSAEDIGQPASNLLLVLLFFYAWGVGLVGALGAIVCSFGFALYLAMRYVKQLFPEVVSAQIRPAFSGKDLLTFSLPASLTGMFGMISIWVDRLLVGCFRSAAEAGIYQAVSQLSTAFTIILSAFVAIFSPMAADFYHRGEMGRLEELFRVCTKWALYLSVPPFLVMCFVPRHVLTVLFGIPYAVGWPALIILALFQVAVAGAGPVGALLVMAGHQNLISKVSGAMLFLCIVLGLILIRPWGMAGAACATACAGMGFFYLTLRLTRRVLGMRPYDRRYLKGLLATVLAAVALWLLRPLLDVSSILGVLLAAIVSAGVFGVTLVLSGLDAEDREFIKSLRAHWQ